MDIYLQGACLLAVPPWKKNWCGLDMVMLAMGYGHYRQGDDPDDKFCFGDSAAAREELGKVRDHLGSQHPELTYPARYTKTK
jgi:hypothetical protein